MVCPLRVQLGCSFTVWLAKRLVPGWCGIVFTLPLYIWVVWGCYSLACLQSCWLIIFICQLLSFISFFLMVFIIIILTGFHWCFSVWLVPMFCAVFILFGYPFIGAGACGWVVDTAGHGSGSILQGLGCWPTAGLFYALHLWRMLTSHRMKRFYLCWTVIHELKKYLLSQLLLLRGKWITGELQLGYLNAVKKPQTSHGTFF